MRLQTTRPSKSSTPASRLCLFDGKQRLLCIDINVVHTTLFLPSPRTANWYRLCPTTWCSTKRDTDNESHYQSLLQPTSISFDFSSAWIPFHIPIAFPSVWLLYPTHFLCLFLSSDYFFYLHKLLAWFLDLLVQNLMQGHLLTTCDYCFPICSRRICRFPNPAASIACVLQLSPVRQHLLWNVP